MPSSIISRDMEVCDNAGTGPIMISFCLSRGFTIGAWQRVTTCIGIPGLIAVLIR